MACNVTWSAFALIFSCIDKMCLKVLVYSKTNLVHEPSVNKCLSATHKRVACMFISVQELLPLMEITQREILARNIYEELVMGILKVLSRLDLSVTQESAQQQVKHYFYVCDRWP